MASWFYLIVSLLELAVVIHGFEIPLNNQANRASLDIDGSWPTVSIRYGSGRDPMDCQISTWTKSIFVLQQQCPNTGYDIICPNSTTAQQSIPKQPPDVDQKVNMTQALVDAFNDPNVRPEVGNLLSVLHLTGEGDGGDGDIEVVNSSLRIAQVIGQNLTMAPSYLAKRRPLSKSLLSLRDLSSRLGASAINLIGLHMGSVEPRVPGSFHIGAYDDRRIMGDVVTFSSFNSLYNSQFGIFGVRIGVEEGFLPLYKLKSDIGFPVGPYSTDILRNGQNSTAPDVKLEPGTPYMHLPIAICEPLAELLDLTYDLDRNVYLWNYEASHPLFHSPTYLEFVLGAGSGVGTLLANSQDPGQYGESISYTTVKIPFALLRPNFQAMTDPETGKTYPPVAYFPCSPVDPPSDLGDFIWTGKRGISTLGRAFLQAAFVGFLYYYDYVGEDATYWVAQAPGPANLSKNVITVGNDVGIPFINRTVAPNAWTQLWSEVLPILKIDADGTTLAERTKPPPALTNRQKIAIGAIIPTGTLAIGFLTVFCWISHMKSRRRCEKIYKDMAEENEIAREREAMARDKQKAQRMAEYLRRPNPIVTQVSAENAFTSAVLAAISQQVDAISPSSECSQDADIGRHHAISPISECSHGFDEGPHLAIPRKPVPERNP